MRVSIFVEGLYDANATFALGFGAKPAPIRFQKDRRPFAGVGQSPTKYTKRAFSFNKLLNENSLFKINLFFLFGLDIEFVEEIWKYDIESTESSVENISQISGVISGENS